jgi:hypothetical protein
LQIPFLLTAPTKNLYPIPAKQGKLCEICGEHQKQIPIFKFALVGAFAPGKGGMFNFFVADWP